MSRKKTQKQLRKRRESSKKARHLRRDDRTNENVPRHNPRCRFCFQGNRDEGVRERLIVACGCKNEGRYVHYQPCLGNEIEISMDAPCRLCGQRYKNNRIERYRYCPSFWFFFNRAMKNCYPNTPVLWYFTVFVGIQMILMMLIPIPFVAGFHPLRPLMFKNLTFWFILAIIYLAALVALISYHQATYEYDHPEAHLLKYIWDALKQYDEDKVVFYYCLIAMILMASFLSFMMYNFVSLHYFRDVSEMDGLLFVCLMVIVAMVFFFAVHYEYVEFKRYHAYPHDMVRLRQWHGAINNERILDITELIRKEIAHHVAQNRFHAMIQQTLEEIRMEEEPAVMEYLNWQLDWDNLTAQQKQQKQPYEDFVRKFYHYYLVRLRNDEWATHFEDEIARAFDIMEQNNIPYDAMPFNLVIQDIVAAVPDY